MIEKVLTFIEHALNQQLSSRFGLEDNIVLLNSFTTPDGGVPLENQNKIVISMVNLEHEAVRPDMVGDHRGTAVQPAQHFGIDLLFSANFDDYREALKFLSATISFFQANSSFSAQTHPAMPAGVSRLNFEVKNTSTEDIHHLWGAMRASYQPSIIYRLRHISIDSEELTAIVPAVTAVAGDVGA